VNAKGASAILVSVIQVMTSANPISHATSPRFRVPALVKTRASILKLLTVIGHSLGGELEKLGRVPQALHVDPGNNLAYSERGLIRLDSGDKRGAISDFTQALRIDSNDASVYSYRGTAFSDLGDRQQAIEDFLIASVLYLKQSDTENYQETLETLRIELSINFLERNLQGITFEGGIGNTLESAIVINGATNGNIGVAAEYYYLDERFGRRKIDWQLEHQTLLQSGERYYDEMHIQLTDGTKTVVFFDITDFHGKGTEDLLKILSHLKRIEDSI